VIFVDVLRYLLRSDKNKKKDSLYESIMISVIMTDLCYDVTTETVGNRARKYGDTSANEDNSFRNRIR
jgi:hypothetical protein